MKGAKKYNMKLLENFKSLLKKFFSKNNDQIKIEKQRINDKYNNTDFLNSLKDGVIKDSSFNENKKVETLICNGDGVGIQNKIEC